MWLPFLPTDRLRRQPAARGERPLVLVEKQRGALRLAALDSVATQLGLRRGMALAEARAIIPALDVADFAPEQDKAALLFCSEAAMRFTPLVALDDADGLMLDITGCAHLFGGEAGLMNAARALMGRLGLASRAAVAGTPDAAHAFARFTQGGIVPPGTEAERALALPVTALEAGLETTCALTRAGLSTLGALAGCPSAALTARFGEDLTIRRRAILGETDRRIVPLRSPPAIMAERPFSEPLSLMESLMAALERLACDIAGRLETRGEGGRAFKASFFRADGIVRHLTVETAEATRDPHRLMRLFRLKIEALADPIDPGFGFDMIRLGVLRGEKLLLRQADLAGGETEDERRAVAALVDRLAARFGRENVLRFMLRDTHDPVRAGAVVPYLSPAPNDPSSNTSWPAPETGEPPARPLTLFSPPHPIEAIAEVPDAPPVRFRWRRVLHEVARAEGPERIAPEWWRTDDLLPATRDYYRIEDSEGHRFWLFREGAYGEGKEPPRWFLHGLFA